MESANAHRSALDFDDPAVRRWAAVYAALMAAPLLWLHSGLVARAAAAVETVLRVLY